MAESSHALVYAETTGVSGSLDLDASKAEQIAGEFDRIYSLVTGHFGNPLDVDGNGKILLLLLDIRDGYEKRGDGYTAGYFYWGDMYHPSRIPEDQPRGNGADMLYVDTWPAGIGSAASFSTMAHELQHLINYSRRLEIKSSRLMDTWIDEGLSTAAEHLYGGVQQDRLDWLSHPRNLTASRGNNFYVWNGVWEDQDSLTNYSTVYLFFQWLRLQADNGAGIYRDIIDALEPDYQAVTGAAARRIEAAYGSWETLLGSWFAASLLQRPSGRWGYKQELNFEPWYLKPELQHDHSISLAPGEGVYSRFLTSPADPDSLAKQGAIRYAGYRAPSGSQVSPLEGGGDVYLVTYNASTENDDYLYYDKGGYQIGDAVLETGYVGDPVSPDLSLKLSRLPGSTGVPAPELHLWDGARYFWEKQKQRNGPWKWPGRP
jgi:hypothetical protein